MSINNMNIRITDMNGAPIRAKAFSTPGFSQRSPENACNNSGMSGADGIFQHHDNDNEAMWLTLANPGNKNWIGFDLGRVERLGWMFVWNFNQTGYTGPGIREARIEYSLDGETFTELKGLGWPYRFAKADGAPLVQATNLDIEGNPPVDFEGISARFVRIVPDERMGVGNWGGYIEDQHRFGISEVRFYSFKPEAVKNRALQAKAFTFDTGHGIERLTACCGLSSPDTKTAVHDNCADNMWLSEIMPKSGEIVFDLDGTYPIDEMHVWNYNEKGQTGAGIRQAEIYYSIDGASWTELKGQGWPYCFARATGEDNVEATNLDVEGNPPVRFGNVQARYIKLKLKGGIHLGTWGGYNMFEYRYGISKVLFFAGEGWCIEPARDYTGLFSRYHGWSGADGIFAAPVDGIERKCSGEERRLSETLMVFGDTFVGQSNPVTRFRKTFNMVNNTAAKLKGMDPGEMDVSFIVRAGEKGYESLLKVPEHKKCIYWMQDCVILNNSLYSFVDNIEPDPDPNLPEGFQFKLTGIDMIRIPVKNGTLEADAQTVCETPLYTGDKYFGCCILPNSIEAGLPFADGYIYVYGLKTSVYGKSLVVARVKPEDFENFGSYTFFDGNNFVHGIENSAEICSEGGSEMSITPIETGDCKGKYLYVYSPQNVNTTISCRLAETPWGPFSDAIPLYHVDDGLKLETQGSKKVYCYNAKGHYHLSREGELLISSNINSMNFESHILNADIYRPRFFRLRKL